MWSILYTVQNIITTTIIIHSNNFKVAKQIYKNIVNESSVTNFFQIVTTFILQNNKNVKLINISVLGDINGHNSLIVSVNLDDDWTLEWPVCILAPQDTHQCE